MPDEVVISADGHNVSFAHATGPGDIAVPNLGRGSRPIGLGVAGVSSQSGLGISAIVDAVHGLGASVFFVVLCLGVAFKHLSRPRKREDVAAPRRSLRSETSLPIDAPENRAAFLARYGQPKSTRN